MFFVLRALRALLAVGGAIVAPLRKKKPVKSQGEFAKGQTVIVVDNEDTPYFIATVVGYQEVGRLGNKFPLIKDKEGVVYFSMSILMPYSTALVKELDELTPIEQWNFLAHDHVQIERGTHRRFPCKCEECKKRRDTKLLCEQAV